MATVHLSDRLDPWARLRKTGAEEASVAPAPSSSGLQMLFVAARRLLGVVLLLLGIMMNLTFVLLPIGVPLALLAVALIAAPDDQ
jgi:hypothetical protein